MSALEHNYEICIKIIQLTGRVHKLAFHLVVFCLKKINIITP